MLGLPNCTTSTIPKHENCHQEIQALFNEDFRRHDPRWIRNLSRYPPSVQVRGREEGGGKDLALQVRHHDHDQQVALADLSFNLGEPKLSKFVKMFAALDRGDYRNAAKELKDSNW